jgi:hypothetical protein
MMLSCQLCDSKSGGLIIYATLKNTVCSWPIIRYKGRKHFYSDVSCTYNLLSISCRQSVQGNTLFCPNTASLWSKDIASDLVESSTFEWIHIKYRVHLQYMFTNKFNIYRAHISGRQTPGLTRCSSPAFVIQYRGGGMMSKYKQVCLEVEFIIEVRTRESALYFVGHAFIFGNNLSQKTSVI